MFVPSKTIWASVVLPRTKWGGFTLETGRQSMSVVPLAPQAPATQVWPAGQAAPADAPVQAPLAPQYWGSNWGSTQLTPHRTVSAGQAHVPVVHTWSAPQAVPADAPVQLPLAPQKARSVCGFTHWPPQ